MKTVSLTSEFSECVRSQLFHLYLETHRLRLFSSNNLSLIITIMNNKYLFIFLWNRLLLHLHYPLRLPVFWFICHWHKCFLHFSKDSVLQIAFLILLARSLFFLCFAAFHLFRLNSKLITSKSLLSRTPTVLLLSFSIFFFPDCNIHLFFCLLVKLLASWREKLSFQYRCIPGASHSVWYSICLQNSFDKSQWMASTTFYFKIICRFKVIYLIEISR